jgi:hypothetical protein
VANPNLLWQIIHFDGAIAFLRTFFAHGVEGTLTQVPIPNSKE